jgi:hypothetical protein
MNVVLDATDTQSFAAVFAGDAAQVRPQPIAKLGRNEGPAVFGAEYAVGVATDVGEDSAVPSGLAQLQTPTRQ